MVYDVNCNISGEYIVVLSFELELKIGYLVRDRSFFMSMGGLVGFG